MKKYLMTGVAALALCAAFTSCSKNEELYNPDVVNEGKAVSIVEKYNQAFLKYVGGTIAPNQTWGFGGYSAAGTRAGGQFANESGAEPRGHMWTHFGFQAPDALSDGQKLRVQYYFQMNKITNPNQPNYGVKDFFMQQVYDGATDPITQDKYGKVGNYSPEVYYDGDNNEINSGNIMNYLKAGSDQAHVNNFNNANYPNPIPNVANWNQTIMDDPSQEHEDQIMLMLNTKTDCFGYLDSHNSVYYKDQWTLVSSATIDDYCDRLDADGYQSFLTAHPGVEDAVVNDKWGQMGRGFIGFDFKLMPDPDPIMKDVYAMYTDARDQTQGSYVYDGNEIKTVDDKNTRILINNSPIPVVSIDLNAYSGDIIGCGGERGHYEFDKFKDYVPGGTNDDCLYLTNHTSGVQSDRYALNLAFIAKKVGEGYLPVYDTGLRLWAKVSDLTDGFYSDWIVSFMLADYNPPVDPDDVCIIAEDLSAQGDTDFDFNDVVFTVEYTSATTAKVTLYAAGGTLPLKVAGREVHEAFNYPNPDAETGKYKMINTGDKADVNDVAPVVLFENLSVNKSLRGNDIVIEVDKGSKNEQGVYVENWIALTATGGEPAAKLCVGTDFATGHKWCAERESIKTKYPVFSAWVTEHPTRIWWK